MKPTWKSPEETALSKNQHVFKTIICSWGGVDFNDQILEPYLPTRKSRYWYKKVSIYPFILAIYNTYLIYYKSTRTPLSYLQYQEHNVSQPQSSSTPDMTCFVNLSYLELLSKLLSHWLSFKAHVQDEGKPANMACWWYWRTGLKHWFRALC